MDENRAKTYFAGIVTAYGAAVRGGYTGTYEDFCKEQAKFAENAQFVSEVKRTVENELNEFETTILPEAVSTVEQAGAGQVQSVKSAGTAQVTNVADEATHQISLLQEEGTAQKQSVIETSDEQSARIEATGDAQIESVQAKGEQVLNSIPDDYTTLERTQMLHTDEVNNTVQSIVFDNAGNVQSIMHIRAGEPIRTDTFVFDSSTITETRTLATGETLTIVTDLATLDTTVAYATS